MMNDFLQAIILGVVEGVTEFLPISSTGHLILVNQWIKFGEPFTFLFDIVIQLGAILAVVVYFWKRLWPWGGNSQVIETWKKALVGIIPALVAGFFLADIVEKQLFHPLVVAVTLLIGGGLLILVEKMYLYTKMSSVSEITLKVAFYIGLFQAISMVPGVSRAGAAIVGALLLGVSRTAAVEFSFFLAVPTMVAASGYSLLKYGGGLTLGQMGVLLTGFIISFLVALAVIRFFLTYIQRHNLVVFGWYRIGLGALILALLFARF